MFETSLPEPSLPEPAMPEPSLPEPSLFEPPLFELSDLLPLRLRLGLFVLLRSGELCLVSPRERSGALLTQAR